MANSQTQKLTAAAALSALNAVFLYLAYLVPFLNISLLIACGALLALVFDACGAKYGLISFAFTGSVSAFLIPFGFTYLLFFAPYSVSVCLLTQYLGQKFTTKDKKTTQVLRYLIRLPVSLLIFNLGLWAIYRLAPLILFDMGRIAEMIGGVAVFWLICNTAFLVFDMLYTRVLFAAFILLSKYMKKTK